MNKQPSPDTVCRTWELWKNPIFLRYCGSRLRLSNLSIWGLMTILLTAFVFGMSMALTHLGRLELSDMARSAIIPVFVIQALILFIFGTAQTSGGMVAEFDEGVIDYQRLLPMSPSSKVIGFVFGLPIREYVLIMLTMPFTLFCFIAGQVKIGSFLAIYGTFFSTAILYHFTGLLTGTCVSNKRWAFLVSIGLVFLLYTVIPQLAKVGIPYFEYLTITPVFTEHLPEILPRTAATAAKTLQTFSHRPRFFDLDFPELLFTCVSQLSFIATFYLMLRRRWWRQESHLLHPIIALSLSIWLVLFMLGNAIPLVDTGEIFPSYQLHNSRYGAIMDIAKPNAAEGVAITAVFGVVLTLISLVISTMVTANYDTQVKGWRLLHRKRLPRMPLLSDAATSTWLSLVISSLCGIAWFSITQVLINSRWFPGHWLSWTELPFFILPIVSITLLFQVSLEISGGKTAFLRLLFFGIIPIMGCLILAVISQKFTPLVIWLSGISPFTQLVTTSFHRFNPMSLELASSKPIYFSSIFWLIVHFSILIYLFIGRNAFYQRLKTQTQDDEDRSES